MVLSYDKTPGPTNMAPLSHEPVSSVVSIKESSVGGRVSRPVEAHDKMSFANDVSHVTLAGFGHGQPQASSMDNEHSKLEPPLRGWGQSIDKTPSCHSLGWSNDRTQFHKDVEEPDAQVPLGYHVDVGNLQLQGSSGAGPVSNLAHSGPPLQHCDFCQFCGGHGHHARECSSIRSWSSSPLKCYNCFGKGHVARMCSSRLRDSFRQCHSNGWPSRVWFQSPARSDPKSWRSRPALRPTLRSDSPNWRIRSAMGDSWNLHGYDNFRSPSRSDSPNWRSRPAKGDSWNWHSHHTKVDTINEARVNFVCATI